jgi:hypothetical protein
LGQNRSFTRYWRFSKLKGDFTRKKVAQRQLRFFCAAPEESGTNEPSQNGANVEPFIKMGYH